MSINNLPEKVSTHIDGIDAETIFPVLVTNPVTIQGGGPAPNLANVESSWSQSGAIAATGATATLIAGTNSDRVSILIQNVGSAGLWIKSTNAATNTAAIYLAQYASITLGINGTRWTNAIYANSATSSTGMATLVETTLL